MRNRTLLLLIAALAAFSAPAAAQPPDRFIQIDSVAITHPPLEFEIRHRIIPYLGGISSRREGSLYLKVRSDFSGDSDSPVSLIITALDSLDWPHYGYCELIPDFWHRPVGYCRIQGYLFMFYDYRKNDPPQKFISPVPGKHRTLELEGYFPITDDPYTWDFMISDYSITFCEEYSFVP